jgi:hypothetical protein
MGGPSIPRMEMMISPECLKLVTILPGVVSRMTGMSTLYV